MAVNLKSLFIVILSPLCVICDDILCEVGFCRGYEADPGCSSTAAECRVNNATHTGLWLPSPTICNCCEYCLPFYGLGADCSRGGPGMGITVGRCGNGLTCDEATFKCIRMESKCHDAQDDYDARYDRGEVGTLENRPYCDGKGKFATFDCIPTQTCFCQSEDGKRIFGESAHTGSNQNMPCGCSRMHDKISKTIGAPYPVVGPRCTFDGNFNPIQCYNRTCYCVDRITGEAHSEEFIDLDEEPISELSCYDPEFDLFPSQSEGKPPYNYSTPCFDSIQERQKLISQSEEDGYNVDFFTTFDAIQCLPDGTFGRVFQDSNGSKVCVDERGTPIGNYSATAQTSEYDNMDCKCALTASLMRTSNEPPKCCQNGNFRPIQCRRGLCRCVDSDGQQISKESKDVTDLTCHKTNWRSC